MNLSLMSSSALRVVWGKMLRRSVITRFLLPGTAPCIAQEHHQTCNALARYTTHLEAKPSNPASEHHVDMCAH